MRPRYLLVAGVGQAGSTDLLDVLVRRTGLRLAFTNPRFAVLVNPDCSCMAAGGDGCIVGTLFHRHGPAEQVTALDSDEVASIVRTNGDALLGAFWGSYVAAVAGAGSVRVLRDPSAGVACYFVRGRAFTAFASDAELLVESGLVGVEFDWTELARHFFRAGVPAPATCLRGIFELLPGFAVSAPAHMDLQLPCWSPWHHVSEQYGRSDPPAERLARTVRHCVHAWAPKGRRLLVSVSGGLDSSIVAACLAAVGADAVCLTMYGEDPAGDERPFARVLCDHLGFRLIERPYRLEAIDIAEPLGPHLPRPQDRTQALEYERAHLEVAKEIGADAFMTGNGGDSVFGYSQSAAAISDRYLCEGMGAPALRTLLDVCRQTGCSLFAAAAGAWRIARREGAYHCRPNPLFLDRAALAGLTAMRLDHPWLEAPSDALPGKAAHIASILRVLQSMEPGRSRHLAVLNPLMSQPIVETCLSVPSWQWRAGGRDRALARQAFASDLPQAILARRVKGGPGGFAAQLLDRFRPAIRERLLDGRLARNGIVDTAALQNVLKDGRPCSNEERVRILEFTAAEAWLDSWAVRMPSEAASGVTTAAGASDPMSADPNA